MGVTRSGVSVASRAPRVLGFSRFPPGRSPPTLRVSRGVAGCGRQEQSTRARWAHAVREEKGHALELAGRVSALSPWGRLRSRTIPSLVSEASRLVEQGVREINIISQDSTAYGRDLRDGTGLGGLMKSLADIDGLEWIRLH